MTIELYPEDEEIIKARMSRGQVSSPRDLVHLALMALPPELPQLESPPTKYQRPPGKKSLAQLFAESPFRGLELDFERSTDTLRPIDL
jgi:hypothetical protein